MIGRVSEGDSGRADPVLQEVANHELSLLEPAVRGNPDAVMSLLHEEFREFGASGRTWNRSTIAAALAADPGAGAEVEDLRARRIADGVVLVTYLARTPARSSLRSSLWVRTRHGWRLLFHQGTPCP